jgi:hypothetical protein
VGPASLRVSEGRLRGLDLDSPLSPEQARRMGPALELPPLALLLVGDNPAESVDSRDYGAVSVGAVSGRILLLGPGEGS